MSVWLWIILALVVIVGFVAFTGAPYVPSKVRDIRRAFDELYIVSAHDVLVDLGSGDGIVLREASKRGARAVGYEIHPLLVIISRWLSRHDNRVAVRQSNFWRDRLPDDVTVVYIFGDGRDIAKMFRFVQTEATRLQCSIAVISYAFMIDEAPEKTVGAHHLYTIKPLQGDARSL